MHGTTAEDYKIEYGLTLRTALCGKSVSRRNSEISTTPKARANFERNRNRWTKTHYSKRRTTAPSGWGSMRSKNQVGLCELQVKARYAVVKDIVGKDPSFDDIHKHDVRLMSGIKTNFKTLNGLKKSLGVEPNKWIEKVPNIECIAAMRKWRKDNRRVPQGKDFHKKGMYPNYCTILNRFGSWSNALRMAGLK